MSNFPISPEFSLARFKIVLEAKDTLFLPKYKGSTITGRLWQYL